MNLVTVAEHTIDTDLLAGGPILDAGCRDFEFATWFADRGHPIVMMDPAEDVTPPKKLYDRPVWSYFHRAALVGEGLPKSCGLSIAGNASRVIWGGTGVRTMTIAELLESTKFFDVVKLDIEGSEYEVLLTWPGPIARQITVEFHEHLGQGKALHGEDVYDRIMAKLNPYYRVVQHEAKPFEGGINWYDSLWVLR